MDPHPFFGVFLHSLGGLAAGSFYIPFKKVRGWSWESYWLVNGVFSWIVLPWLVALLVCPNLIDVFRDAPLSSMGWAYFFGALWGVGGLTFGLSMRYLGMSLGYALALGFCAAFGTIIPPMFTGKLGPLVESNSGLMILAGVGVCLAGIALCGRAGWMKERELSPEQKKATIREFSFVKGVWVAIFAGIMSACMAFGISAGKPMAELATKYGTSAIWSTSPIYVLVMAGGFTTNFIWCVFLNVRNKSSADYLGPGATASALASNYLFSALAGTIWYMQFLFYGMGTTQMGRYDFSSWAIHMAFIIVFSNLWGLYFLEWRGVSRSVHRIVFAGILVLVASTLVIGLGNYLATLK
ncbi:MAG: L-rhamnose/proton symporter RhaT [Candidatus Hydrogenedentes bacterium]|nr:L-rhamnose/proton symporter RhaT [Candidatus Hydrogenedentota bacterium]